ncbi:MAG: cardiolipin synthase [Sphingomonadales bacterium]|nr:cardiolipin synthase [Sphingomonadales bacterium]
MAAYQLLVGSDAFWARAASDIEAASERVLVQAMTFEGDAAGQGVAAAVRGSGAADRRVLVDDYTRVVVSDCFVKTPRYLADSGFRGEVRATRAMFQSLKAAGVGVRTTNPIAGRLPRYGLRNHKKLIVADGVAYVGGVNFSDHNFAWHDLMLRIEDREAADFLAADFAATWESRSIFAKAKFGALTLYALDGRTNREGFADLFDAIASAKDRIEIVSPYLSFPFLDRLGEAAARGVEVELIAPLGNNKPMVRHYLFQAAPKVGLRLRLSPGMFHLKAMLIDGRLLVLGSSNFDFPSYYSMEEYLAFLTDPALIADFRAEVLEPLTAGAVAGDPPRSPWWHRTRSNLVLQMGRGVVSVMGRMPRSAVDWRG